jgi:hypothetical protein
MPLLQYQILVCDTDTSSWHTQYALLQYQILVRDTDTSSWHTQYALLQHQKSKSLVTSFVFGDLLCLYHHSAQIGGCLVQSESV